MHTNYMLNLIVYLNFYLFKLYLDKFYVYIFLKIIVFHSILY